MDFLRSSTIFTTGSCQQRREPAQGVARLKKTKNCFFCYQNWEASYKKPRRGRASYHPRKAPVAARDPRTACATVTGSDFLLVAHRGQQKQCTESKQQLKLGVNVIQNALSRSVD